MKIVIEGCDGVGKSTAVSKLAKKYNLDICHCTQRDPSDFGFYQETLRKENIVWDRHFIGELIYPKVFDRDQNISAFDAYELVNDGKSNGVKFFIMTADIETIRERLTRRGNECVEVLENLEYINNKFIDFASIAKIPIIKSDSDVDVITQIEKYLR